MKVKRKNQEEHYLGSHWKKKREGDITRATSTSQEEEVPLKAKFIDENLDINMEEFNEPTEVIHESMKIVPGDHTYCLPSKNIVSKINKLTMENKESKYRSIVKTSTFTRRKIKTDAKMKFYTRINTIVLFNKIFRLIQPFLTDIISWKGPNHAKNYRKVRYRGCNNPKKLSQRDEFLLTLMRLRLGLLNKDLAERFGVSPTLVYIYNNIFTT